LYIKVCLRYELEEMLFIGDLPDCSGVVIKSQ